jgi:pimeloyl-ACP methyl ester carboxylesterase
LKSASGLEEKSQHRPTIEELWAVVDGSRMRYLRSGGGPPFVLVHGLLGYSFSWRFAMPVLAQHASVYALDMLGTGFSDRPAGLDCSLRASAGRLLRFFDAVGVSSCDLLGTSYGGAVVMMAAALAPDRIRRLILVAPVHPWLARGRRLAPFLSSRVISPLFMRLAPCFEVAHKVILRRLFGDPRRIRPGTLEGYSAPFAIPGSFQYAGTLLRSWNSDLHELESVLPQIAQIPTLLMWGGMDTAVNPSSAARLRQCFVNSSLAIFDGVGHLPYEEVPEEFNQAVTEFLAASSPPALILPPA